MQKATNNKKNAEEDANQIKPSHDKPLVSPNKAIKVEPRRDAEGESTTLNNFRETLKDVLEEITSLEVNTMIVSKIPMKKFDAKDFYLELIENVMYKTAGGLQDIKESLLERSNQLKQKGLALPQQTSTPLLPKESIVIDEYRAELNRYNQNLEYYRESERLFNERNNSQDKDEKARFDLERSCYVEMSKQMRNLNIKKDANGELIIDAQLTRLLRKLWEFEQSVLNGDRIYAQTKFQLDGDLTNRFLDDLFVFGRNKIDPKTTQLVFDIHRQGLENAQKQWSGLIQTCVGLITSLIPFRPK